MDIQYIFLFLAGILGGVINAVAGGGSLVTFPVLVFSGLPLVVANATNTFSAFFSYLFGAYSLREHLFALKKQLWFFLVISLVGGYIGAWLLLYFSSESFGIILPYLLLFATVLFAFGSRLNAMISKVQHLRSLKAVGILFGLGVCIYGGYFNAGFGVLLMVYLVLFFKYNIATINAVKLYISTLAAIIAIAKFGFEGIIAYKEGLIVGVGAGLGGYLGGVFSKKMSEQIVKNLVVAIGLALSLYYFVNPS